MLLGSLHRSPTFPYTSLLCSFSPLSPILRQPPSLPPSLPSEMTHYNYKHPSEMPKLSPPCLSPLLLFSPSTFHLSHLFPPHTHTSRFPLSSLSLPAISSAPSFRFSFIRLLFLHPNFPSSRFLNPSASFSANSSIHFCVYISFVHAPPRPSFLSSSLQPKKHASPPPPVSPLDSMLSVIESVSHTSLHPCHDLA